MEEVCTDQVSVENPQFKQNVLRTILLDPRDLDMTKFPVRILYKDMESLRGSIDQANGNWEAIKVQDCDAPPYPVIDGGRRIRSIIEVDRLRVLRSETRERIRHHLSGMKIHDVSSDEFESFCDATIEDVFGDSPYLERTFKNEPQWGFASEEDRITYHVDPSDVESALRGCGHRVDRGYDEVEPLPDTSPLRVQVNVLEIDDEDAHTLAWVSNSSRVDLDENGDTHHRDEYVAFLVLEKGYPQTKVSEMVPIRPGSDKTLSFQTVSNIVRTRRKASPKVRNLLRHGVLSTHQVRDHLIELTHHDQERFARMIEENQVAIYDILKDAKKALGRIRAMERMQEHLRSLEGTQLEHHEYLELGPRTIRELFPSGKHMSYSIRRQDVDQVIRDLDISRIPSPQSVSPYEDIIQAPLEEDMVRPASLAQASRPVHQERQPQHKKAKAPVNRGESCVSFVTEIGKCMNPNFKDCESCDLYLQGKPSQRIVHICPICNGQTRIGYQPGGALAAVRLIAFDGDQWGLKLDTPYDLQYMMHAQCLIDKIIKSKHLIGGECEACQREDCDIVHALRYLPERVIHVKACGGRSLPRESKLDSDTIGEVCNRVYVEAVVEKDKGQTKLPIP